MDQNLIGRHCTLSSFVTVLVPYKIKFQNTSVLEEGGDVLCFMSSLSFVLLCKKVGVYCLATKTQSLFEAFLKFIANSEKLQKGFYWTKVWGREVFETQVLLRPNAFSAIIEILFAIYFLSLPVGFVWFCMSILGMNEGDLIAHSPQSWSIKLVFAWKS